MACVAGLLVEKGTAFAIRDRQSLTITKDAPSPGFVTLAFWDQAKDDEHSVIVLPKEQYERASQAYLGV